MMLKILFLLVCGIALISAQLNNISLSRTQFFIQDTQLGNLDISRVIVDPPNSLTVCFIQNVVNSGTGATLSNHPFSVRYEPSGLIYNWHVIFNAESPNKLNSALIPIYRITVQCSSLTANVTVQVLPNQRPVIAKFPGETLTFSATAVSKGSTLYTVSATDGDNDQLIYSYSIQPAVDYFAIDKVTNVITAAVDFRSVTVTPVVIHVNVSDTFSTVTGFRLNIQVSNLNSQPQILNLPRTISVREDASPGQVLLALQYEDPDFNGGTFSPTCTVQPDSQSSIITVFGDKISLANAQTSGQTVLDYEKVTRHMVTCSISDGFLTSQNDTLVINVEDVNEQPVFNQKLYSCRLLESKADVSTCNLFLTVTDPDNDATTLSIRPGNSSQRFKFTSASGDALTFAVDYDVDNNNMPTNVFIEAEARDTKGAAGVASIQITIDDANDNTPTFPPTAPTIDVSQSSGLGIIDIVTATDGDLGTNGEVVYASTSIIPATASNYILVQADGMITYTQKFPDSLKGTAVLVTIEARDKGIPPLSSSTSRTIRFLDDSQVTTVPPTLAATTQPTPAPTAAQTQNFLDDPVNVALIAIVGVLLLVGLIVAFYFCVRYMLLGYCCNPKPTPSRVHPAYEDDYYDRGSRYTGYSRDPRYSGYGRDPRYTDYDRDARYMPYPVDYDPRYYPRNPRYAISPNSVIGDFYSERSNPRGQLAIKNY